MPYKEPVNKICLRCNDLYSTKSNKKLLCDGCQVINNREKHRKRCKKYYDLRKPKSRQNKKLCICRVCLSKQIHRGHGLCHNCYEKWRYLRNKLKSMSESEKRVYLVDRGLIKDSDKGFSLEDFKRDLGVL